MRQNVTLLGSLLIAQGALGLLVALIVLVSVAGGGLLSGDADAMAVTSIVGLSVGGFLALLALPSLIAGIGLLSHKRWGRIFALVVCVLSLLHLPLGTALGIFGIYVLTRDETAALFA
ncbi:MAG: hypothetical protein R3C71_10635 [Candidatus Krumholzibacteriia bacterium]|nr:hypothetical protein [bacterium]MCB9514212.1 hypothetical protein [Candidatus Latescibacterota bacterium]MCB9515881.1 hypothetical protein [Candidatus Latescibacterota bacterium]